MMRLPLRTCLAFSAGFSLAASTVHAQAPKYKVTMPGGLGTSQGIPRAQLRGQLASKVRIEKLGADTVRARLLMLVSRNGRPEKVFISSDFPLAGGVRTIPSGVLPTTDWLPDGAQGSGPAAFGWFPDWLNRLLGLSSEPQTLDPENSDAARYWKKEDARNKAAGDANIYGPGNSQLQGGPNPGAGLAVLSLIVLPVSGSDAATAGVQGVSIPLGAAR